MRILLTALMSLALLQGAYSQVVINEIFPGGTVELKNNGSTTVNVGSYWLCDFPSYHSVDGLNTVSGSLNMAPGGILVIDNFNFIDASDGELGLYSSSNFINPTAILDYVEWGSTGHTRSSVAVSAGIWTTGDFHPAFASGESLAYDGDGDSSSDWTAGTPTLGAENAPACDIVTGDITLEDGTTSTSICVDGNADPLTVITSGGTPDVATGWIITDDSNNILALPPGGPFDLDGAGVGTCIIWYIRYDDTDFGGNMVGNNLSDLTGCYDLSNGIEVIREAPDGGTVSLLDGSTTYTGTAGDIMVSVQHETESPNLSYWYIITDDNDNILGFANSAETSTLDLSGAPAGECHIWGWNYRGLPNPVMGENISTLNDDDCEEISSNFITVIREEAPEGPVTQLNAAFCDQEFDLSGFIRATAVPTADSYVFRYSAQSNGETLFSNSLSGSDLTFLEGVGLQYNETYDVSVAVVVDEEQFAFGPSCPILIPEPTTSLNAAFCDGSFQSSDFIRAIGVADTDGYVFQFVPQGGGDVLTADSDGTSNLIFLSGIGLEGGVTYDVSVAIILDGVTLGFGPSCSISFEAPSTVVNPFYCDEILQENGIIRAFAIPNADNYIFLLVPQGGGTAIFANSIGSSDILSLSGLGLIPGTTYDVSVAVVIGVSALAFGDSCPITIDGGTAPVSGGVAGDITTAIYPNPTNLGYFNLNVMGLRGQSTIAEISVYSSTGVLVQNEHVSFESGEINKIVRLEDSLPIGVYQVIISGTDFRENTSLVIQR